MKLYEITQYKQDLDAQSAWDLLNLHCQDALKDLDSPIVRGMTPFKSGFGIIHGEAGHRISANTTNHYTVILDKVLGDLGYPKRSKSIICANWKSLDQVFSFGKPYVIIPFDGVKIGVCPSGDLWHTSIKIGSKKQDIESWNMDFSNLGIDDDLTFSQLIQSFKDEINDGEHLFGNLKVDDVENAITSAYTTPFKLATTASSHIYNDDNEHEVWIGGKCVAIDTALYKSMMKNPPDRDDF